jgi:hypothetical protein
MKLGMSAGPLTLSAPPVVNRLVSGNPGGHAGSCGGACFRAEVFGERPMASQVNFGVDDSGKNDFPARSICRCASGKKASLPTATILPFATATPPSIIPPGVTIKPLLRIRSAMSLAIRYLNKAIAQDGIAQLSSQLDLLVAVALPSLLNQSFGLSDRSTNISV